ncbi:MAG TPA: NADH-quinone oxidoreductase subunit B [Myxococcales bacterium]|nr:NADH-quinone oxidoreductase subunit B [Deltaproteobacteria bacterium]HAA53681.1 NADH-quinone oxidoreductase subunit B [Myxococcales bacterium]
MSHVTLHQQPFIQSSLKHLVEWAEQHVCWPMPYETACCSLELMAATSGNYDLARFGAELTLYSPKQADLLLVLGTITCKQAPFLQRVYHEMLDPKWVIAVGGCAASGGPYNNYHTVQGVDGLIPVDLYVPGCPPRPEAIMNAIFTLMRQHEDSDTQEDLKSRRSASLFSLKQTESFQNLAKESAKKQAHRKQKYDFF